MDAVDRRGLLIVLAALLALRPEVLAGARPDRLDHWAFKPIGRPAVPAVRNESWPRNPIDRFILARLEREGLEPSPEADRRTLIRRLAFDLTGMPPSPDEVEQFVGDPDLQAYEKLVDRLLASPHHGERWARHWLDVVHFGESHGYDKDKPRTNAWPYRDYVIRAFNADKSYSRFVQEQLAGDALFADEPEGIVALGFVAAGPWDFVGHAELPETKTDGLIARYNDRDDMVMTTMSTFLSLTVHCARCHDHKFDPISTAEYYALQAVFAGVDRSDRPYDSDPSLHARRQALLLERKNVSRRQTVIESIAARLTSPEIKRLDAELARAEQELGRLPARGGGESPANGYHSAIEARPDIEKWVQVDLGSPRDFDEIRLIPARPTDFADTPGFGFPPRFRIELADTDTFQNRRVVVDHTREDFANPGDVPFVGTSKAARSRYVRLTATRLWERTGDFVLALAELQVLAGTNNLALWAPVQALDSIEEGRWGKARLVDGFDSRRSLGGAGEPPELATQRHQLEAQIKELKAQRLECVDRELTPELQAERRQVRDRLAELDARLGGLPRPNTVYAAANDFAPSGNFRPPDGARPVHLLKRGSVKAQGELMKPGALACLPGMGPGLTGVDPDGEASRRAALALWITDPRNDLMRRSIVNRLWHHHFGRGLVDTPNDFGHIGSRPTHPELLDWLANWFRENDESFKSLHRLMVTSATWRQASAQRTPKEGQEGSPDREGSLIAPSDQNKEPARAEQIDADNRLLWRMNRQRLDAESLRDAILCVSGRLDLAMGGPSIQQFWFKDDHSPTYDYARFDVDSPGACRRSIYRFIVRSVPDPFMDTMDCPDASLITPVRNTTLSALQALALLNNPFVISQCEKFARRLERERATLPEQVARAFELALCRPPTPHEMEQVGSYAQRYGVPAACRLLLNSNEFVFVD